MNRVNMGNLTAFPTTDTVAKALESFGQLNLKKRKAKKKGKKRDEGKKL